MKGTLIVLGIGPGSPEMMSQAARREIEESQVIVGYTRYLSLVKDLIQGKETFGTGMTKETERVRESLNLAATGKRVCLISSGDAGVYGMAGLALELQYAMELEDQVEVKVVPGITAANSCASLLGAPLMHDFAVISLSDLLTPKETILRRLELAAEGDFVTVLYNPKSKKRVDHIEQARQIYLKHRKGSTPVGVVNEAYRETCEVMITTLDELEGLYDRIHMGSTVIIGNSATRRMGDRMVTPRGYEV